MSSEPRHPPPAACTFILRLYVAWTGESLAWRGWIEHLPSGERAAVQNWEDVTAFVRRFGVDGEEGDEGRKDE